MNETSPSPSGRRFRKLRIAFSAACGIVCLLLIALWVRSNWRSDTVQILSGGSTIYLDSNQGVAFFCVQRRLPPVPVPQWSYYSTTSDNGPTFKQEFWMPWGPTVKGLQSPMWMPTTLVAALAGAPWLRGRFTLRTLLIAMTLVAVVLGAVVWVR